MSGVPAACRFSLGEPVKKTRSFEFIVGDSQIVAYGASDIRETVKYSQVI